MGGKALKKTIKDNNLIRCNKEELFKTKDIVSYELINFFKNEIKDINEIKIDMPKFLKNKKTFGDIDIVIGKINFSKELLLNYLLNKFNSEISVNSKNLKGNIVDGDIVSFGFPLKNNFFQVDLIFVPKEDFETTINYFAYNDLSNLAGRLARRLGLKLTMKGLEFPVVLKNNIEEKEKIILTKKLNEILETLDLNLKKYEEGFENQEEMFNFIISSKYFDVNSYILKNLNHKDRKKDAVRPNYQLFLNYLNKEIVSSKFSKIIEIDKVLTKKQFLKKFNKEEKYNNIILKKENDILIKKYFNGNIVSKLFNVKGKKLGQLMKEINQNNLKKEIDKFILKTNKTKISEQEKIKNINNFILKNVKNKIIINILNINKKI